MKSWTVKPATTKTLAELFGVSYKVFRAHIKPFQKEIGNKIGNYFSVKQVLVIMDKIGTPLEVDIVYPTWINKKEETRL